MEFHRDERILWSQQVAPAQKLALGPMALGLVSFEQIAPGTCWFLFQPDANPVVLATKLPGGQPGPSITLRRQVEAHLFARDPQEVFDTLASIGNDRATWLRETSVPSVLPSEPPPWSLPDDTVVPYPFAPHFIPKPTVLRPIVPLDFWHDAKDAVRAGPGNDPLGGIEREGAARDPNRPVLDRATNPRHRASNCAGVLHDFSHGHVQAAQAGR
jgi:hypothetical protein